MQRIEQILTRTGYTVTLHRGDQLPAVLELDEFDGFLVAASIIGGRHQRYIRGFVRRHVNRLNTAPSAFVSVSGSAGSADPKVREHAQHCMEQFLRETGWRPRLARIFGGAMAFTRYNFALRFIVRWISRRNGGPADTSRDYELTDWKAVDHFAHELATAMAGASLVATSGDVRSAQEHRGD